MKKIISAGLATILAASALSTAAFAEEFTMTAESIIAKPALKVTLPKSMAFVFNPYQMQVDIKGKVDATNGKDTLIVPSYAFETDATGWVVTNGSGAPLAAAVYAYAENKDGATFLVLDATSAEDLSGDTKADMRALKVGLAVASDDEDAEYSSDADFNIVLQSTKLDTKTVSIWNTTESNATTVSTFTDKLTVSIDNGAEEATKTLKGSNKTAWTEKDVAKINFIFAFEFAEPEE